MTIAMLLQNTLLSFLKLVILLIFLGSCQKQNPCTYFKGESMSSPYQVVIGKALSQKEQKRVQKAIEETLEKVHNTFEDEVALLNRASSDALTPLSPAMQDALSLCHEVVLLSCGRFDPTIEPLAIVWKNKAPSVEELQEACDVVGWQHLSIQNGIFKKDNALTKLNLQGIAKGIGVDLLSEELKKLGFTDFMVEWGVNFRANGHHPSNSDWLIPVNPAFTTNEKPMAPIALRNAALAINSNSPSIIDPMTAAPLEKSHFSVAFVTVISPTCTLANALATSTLLFSTRKEAEGWAQEVVEKYPDVQFWILSYAQ